ncbi:MAG: hypothetical protein ABJG68_16960 [Crocinitomicaceae bacterium]
MKHLVFILILLVFTTSCKKKHSITIQAQDYITGDGLAYANMPFSVIQSLPGGGKIKTVYEGVLDESGHASFDLKMHRNWVYVLSVSQPDNICYGSAVIHYLDNESSNFVPIDYLKCGYINLPRINSNCESEQDRFRFKYYFTANPEVYIYTGYLDSEMNWDPDDYLEGCIDYSTAQSYNDRPVGNYTIEWMVERTSGTTYGVDTFEIFENDSTTYLIEY